MLLATSGVVLDVPLLLRIGPIKEMEFIDPIANVLTIRTTKNISFHELATHRTLKSSIDVRLKHVATRGSWESETLPAGVHDICVPVFWDDNCKMYDRERSCAGNIARAVHVLLTLMCCSAAGVPMPIKMGRWTRTAERMLDGSIIVGRCGEKYHIGHRWFGVP